MSGFTTATEETLEALAAEKVHTVVDFWAPWCGPCRALHPVVEKLAEEYGSSVRFLSVNVDENSALAERFHVRSIPTLVRLKWGEEAARSVGWTDRATLIAKLGMPPLDDRRNPLDPTDDTCG